MRICDMHTPCNNILRAQPNKKSRELSYVNSLSFHHRNIIMTHTQSEKSKREKKVRRLNGL